MKAVLGWLALALVVTAGCDTPVCESIDVAGTIDVAAGGSRTLSYRVTGGLPVHPAVLKVRPLGPRDGIVLKAGDPATAALGFSCASREKGDEDQGYCSMSLPLEAGGTAKIVIHAAEPGAYTLAGTLQRRRDGAADELLHAETICTTDTRVHVTPDAGADTADAGAPDP
jgi:hypothetical protein